MLGIVAQARKSSSWESCGRNSTRLRSAQMIQQDPVLSQQTNDRQIIDNQMDRQRDRLSLLQSACLAHARLFVRCLELEKQNKETTAKHPRKQPRTKSTWGGLVTGTPQQTMNRKKATVLPGNIRALTRFCVATSHALCSNNFLSDYCDYFYFPEKKIEAQRHKYIHPSLHNSTVINLGVYVYFPSEVNTSSFG